MTTYKGYVDVYGPDKPAPRVTSNYSNAKVAHAEEAWIGEKNSVKKIKRGYITQEELYDERCQHNREAQRKSHQNGPAS